MAANNRKQTGAGSANEVNADKLQQAIRALGRYDHVAVNAQRGHLVISTDGDPIARLTPLGTGNYGMSFRNHTGRWEPMPFEGDLAQQAENLASALGPHLERWEFTGGNSGSDH